MKKNVKYRHKRLLLITGKKSSNFQKFEFIKISRIILIIMILLIIFIIAYYLLFHYNNKYQETNGYSNLKKENIINSNVLNILENYQYNKTNRDELIPYLNYIEYAKEGIFLNKNKYKASNNPKISIIISLFNREQYIKSALRSVQNQDLLDIEIIVINDLSTDNSSEFVKEYQKEDQRIILLENKENMGTLYSKSIGALYAKGEYIHSLDSDDMLCNRKYLSIVYNEAIKGNFDLIESKAIYIKETEKKIDFRHPYWVVLWSKLIRKELYLNSIFSIGIDVLKMKVKTLDDDIFALSLFVSKKPEKLNVIGPAHFLHKSGHVYFGNKKNLSNIKIFCRNFLNTIRAFYVFNNPFSYKYGKALFDNHFLRGACSSSINPEEIKEFDKTKFKL